MPAGATAPSPLPLPCVGYCLERWLWLGMSTDGVRPESPVGVAATWQRSAVHISWRHPSAPRSSSSSSSSSSPVSRYDIQYRTVGQWVPLASVSVNATSYDWTTASRGATYQFRMFSVTDDDLRSEPSASVRVRTTGTRTFSGRACARTRCVHFPEQLGCTGTRNVSKFISIQYTESAIAPTPIPLSWVNRAYCWAHNLPFLPYWWLTIVIASAELVCSTSRLSTETEQWLVTHPVLTEALRGLTSLTLTPLGRRQITSLSSHVKSSK